MAKPEIATPATPAAAPEKKIERKPPPPVIHQIMARVKTQVLGGKMSPEELDKLVAFAQKMRQMAEIMSAK